MEIGNFFLSKLIYIHFFTICQEVEEKVVYRRQFSLHAGPYSALRFSKLIELKNYL